jgi:restriction system protein
VAIPDFQSCMRPLLNAVQDGEVHTFNDAFEKVCLFFKLTDTELAAKLPSGKQAIIRNRVAWSSTYMKKAGLLFAPGRSQLQITERGLEALKQQPERIDVRYLKQFPEFLEFHTAKPKSVTTDTLGRTEDTTDSTDPLERLEEAHLEIQNSLASDLLQTIKEQSPAFMERLVVELMQSMGYGGWSKKSGTATQYTADGGIDGIINEDPLGLDTIYLQAKRYTDNTVGRPDIQQFAGALDMQRAKKGVFITTSQFSKEATDYVANIDKQIVLINGTKLAKLMIQYGLGVAIKQTYAIKQIDSDYFTED